MKKITEFLIGVVLCFTLSSCITTAQAQIDDVYDDNVDINLVITYGTPYYNVEGLLLYYIYDNLYYYPYYYHNRYYLHRYSRPIPPHWRNRYRPVSRDFYKHNRHDRHFGNHPPKHRWDNHGNVRPPRNNGKHNHNGNIFPNRNRNQMQHMDRNKIQHNSIPRTNGIGSRSVSPRPSQQGRVGGYSGKFGGKR